MPTSISGTSDPCPCCRLPGVLEVSYKNMTLTRCGFTAPNGKLYRHKSWTGSKLLYFGCTNGAISTQYSLKPRGEVVYQEQVCAPDEAGTVIRGPNPPPFFINLPLSLQFDYLQPTYPGVHWPAITNLTDAVPAMWGPYTSIGTLTLYSTTPYERYQTQFYYYKDGCFPDTITPPAGSVGTRFNGADWLYETFSYPANIPDLIQRINFSAWSAPTTDLSNAVAAWGTNGESPSNELLNYRNFSWRYTAASTHLRPDWYYTLTTEYVRKPYADDYLTNNTGWVHYATRNQYQRPDPTTGALVFDNLGFYIPNDVGYTTKIASTTLHG